MNALEGRRYLVLLLVLGGGLLVLSVTHGRTGTALLADALVTLIVLAVFFGVFQTKRERVVSLVAGVFVIGCNWGHYVLPTQYEVPLAMVFHGSLMVFFGWGVAAILRGVFAGGAAVRTDDIFGVLCGYLLAGSAWANLYAVTELFFPGSFSVSPAIAGQFADWHGRRALYNDLSLGSMTTVGYAAMTPIRAPMTSFIVLTAVFGQFYVAVVVAQIVALKLVKAEGDEPK